MILKVSPGANMSKISKFWKWLGDSSKTSSTVLIMLLLFLWNGAAVLLALMYPSSTWVLVLCGPVLAIQMVSLMSPMPGLYLLILFVVARTILELKLYLTARLKAKKDITPSIEE